MDDSKLTIIRKCAADMNRAAEDLIRRSDPVTRRNLALAVQRKSQVILDLCDGKEIEGVTTNVGAAPVEEDPVNTEEQPRSPAVEAVAAVARPRAPFPIPGVAAEAKE